MTQPINEAILPVEQQATTNEPINSPEKRFIQYLLGILSMAHLNHKIAEIFIYFPVTKKSLAYMLKDQFGGFVRVQEQDGIVLNYYYQMRSKEGLTALWGAIKKRKSMLPPDVYQNFKAFFTVALKRRQPPTK